MRRATPPNINSNAYVAQGSRLKALAFSLQPRARKGSVLLYVVWAVTLLSLFAASVGSQAAFALQVTERLSEQLRAEYLARGAAQYAALALARDPTVKVDGRHESWSEDPAFQAHDLAGGSFRVTSSEPDESVMRYGVTDEDRRLSLNAAPAEVLARLFELVGEMREPEAVELADAIQDWRDTDDHQSPHGAEGFYYRSLGAGYDCKDGPFENMEELLLVRGITPALFHRLAPYLTVYGSGPLNLNTAGETVLQALGLSGNGIDGLLAFRAGEDNTEGTFDDRLLISTQSLEAELKQFVPVEDLARLIQLADAGVVGAGSADFRMQISASSHHAAREVTVTCVTGRKGEVRLWDEH